MTQQNTASLKGQTKRLVLAAVFLALGLLLPFLTGQIPVVGSRLLPMHLPVLLCGLLCGWPFGLAVGAVTPLLRSLLFGMPPMMPTAVAMAFELAAYGAIAGLVMARLPKKISSVYIALAAAMLGGRVIWGIVSFVLHSLLGSQFTWAIFVAQAFVNPIIGIAVQLVILPPLTLAIWKIEERI